MTNENIHDRFETIKHTPLRVFNRVVMMMNLKSISREESMKYMSTFSDAERVQMGAVMAYMKQHGEEATRKTCTKGLEIVDE